MRGKYSAKGDKTAVISPQAAALIENREAMVKAAHEDYIVSLLKRLSRKNDNLRLST